MPFFFSKKNLTLLYLTMPLCNNVIHYVLLEEYDEYIHIRAVLCLSVLRTGHAGKSFLSWKHAVSNRSKHPAHAPSLFH